MLAEIALKRQQFSEAYRYIDELTSMAIATETYAKMVKLLRAKRHADYRYQLVQKWQRAFPEDQQASNSLAKEMVCRNEPDNLNAAHNALRLNDSVDTFEAIAGCLTGEKAQSLIEGILAKDNGIESIKLYRCQLIANAQQVSEAIRCFETAGKVDDYDSLKRLASLYHQDGRITDAINTYQRLLVNNPEDDTSRYELAGIYYDQRQFDSAIEELLIVNKSSPKNRNVQYLLAASYFSLKQYRKSRFWFEETLFSKQFRNRAFYYLGMIAIEMNEIPEAKRYLSSVEQSAEYLPAQLNYWRLVARDDLDEAIFGLYDLLDAMPEDRMSIKLVQIDLYDNAGESQRATQELVTLADDYPNHLRLQILRIQWLTDQGYIDRVPANLQASLAGLTQLNDQQQLVNSTVYHLMEQQHGPIAVQVLAQQTAIAKDSDHYKLLEGLSHAMAENYPTAINILSEMLTRNPDRHDIKNALGYTLTLQGEDFQRAEELILAALDDAPDNASYLDSLGWLRFNEGDISAAEELLTKANSLTRDPVIKGHLVEVYLAQKKSDEAIALLSEAKQYFPDSTVIKKLDALISGAVEAVAND